MAESQAEKIRAAVRDRYAQAALTQTTCCGPSSCCGPEAAESDVSDIEIFGAARYSSDEHGRLPQEAVVASLGCGNPTAVAALHPGEVVLDLGSGGGIDVLLSAQRVAPGGWAYGLDMTEEMVELARANAGRAGVENVTFLLGTMENIPLPDNSVDVIISNCVVNLAADKAEVLREARRVLRPGGRLAMSDMVLARALPQELGELMGLWTGCIAGALVIREYEQLLRSSGFQQVAIETTSTLSEGDLRTLAEAAVVDQSGGLDVAAAAIEMNGVVCSAIVRGINPE